MKKNSFTIFMILLFAVSNFSQVISSTEAVYKFWNLALKNDFETAKKQIDSISFDSEKLEKLKKSFQTISQNELKISKFSSQDVQPTHAFFAIKANGKDGLELIAHIRLTKSSNFLSGWQITNLQVFTYVSLGSGVVPRFPDFATLKQNEKQNAPLELYNEKKKAAEYLAEPYNPQKNPVALQFIIRPKP